MGVRLDRSPTNQRKLAMHPPRRIAFCAKNRRAVGFVIQGSVTIKVAEGMPYGRWSMKLPLFRVRTLVVGVAMIAGVCGAEAGRRRRAFCLREAAYHAQKAKQCDAIASARYPSCFSCPPDARKMDDDMTFQLRQTQRRRAIYHRYMVAEYRRASSHLWEPAPRETSRQDAYQEQAIRHAKSEVFSRRAMEFLVKDEARSIVYDLAQWTRWRNEVTYHARMRRKYEAAVKQPWLPVEPDPPERECGTPQPPW